MKSIRVSIDFDVEYDDIEPGAFAYAMAVVDELLSLEIDGDGVKIVQTRSIGMARLICFFLGHRWVLTNEANLNGGFPLNFLPHRRCARCEEHQVQHTFPVYKTEWQK